VPVALNSGECWRRQAFLKTPGTVTVSIGPAIDPAGKTAEEVNTLAEAWIETEMRRISPRFYRHETVTPAPTGSAA
jgi:1-acyl-sn-glycerol-3-phosphate acyltransferase